MHPKRPPVPVIVIVLLALLIGGYYGLNTLFAEDNGALQASGTIEAVDINVSPEMVGKVIEVLASEGDTIKMDSPLLYLDDSLLIAQRAVAVSQLDSAIVGIQLAQSALNTAKYQYQITLETAQNQDQQTRLQDWFAQDPHQFEQPGWYFTRTEQINAAQSKVELALQVLEDAQSNQNTVTQSLETSDFLKAEGRLLNARLDYLIAKDVNNRCFGCDVRTV